MFTSHQVDTITRVACVLSLFVDSLSDKDKSWTKNKTLVLKSRIPSYIWKGEVNHLKFGAEGTIGKY